jgi:hypothetical protein
MVFCDAKSCLGGEDDEELLRELRRYGLWERFEGLVLGLGPAAMLLFVWSVLRRPGARQSGAARRARRVAAAEARCSVFRRG